MPSPRELLVCLLDYIKEQAKDINPRAFTLKSHKAFVKTRTELSGLPGVEFDIRIEGDHIWMRVERLSAESPPNAPEVFKGLFKIGADPKGAAPSLDEPAYLRHLSAKVQRQQEVKTEQQALAFSEEDRKRSTEALNSYVATWRVWASREGPRRETIALYGDLFALMHQLEAEETSKPQELVWGLGVSTWMLNDGERSIAFEYPLLSQTMEITLDEESMAIELRPRSISTRVELDAIIACQVRGSVEVDRALQEQIAKHRSSSITPFDPGSYTDLLKLVAANLDSEGTYREVIASEESAPSPGSELVVTDDWVLLSRPRSVNYLFEDLARLREKLEEGCPIYGGPLALVTEASDQVADFEPIHFRGLSSRGQGGGNDRDLYFPLPYNDEQVTIIQRLEKTSGVAVQGPPGTGKTHTIANVICHYLASGKRVLVTSRGEAALSVLQEKIPEEIRRLTVALLTSDREGVRQFQGAIEAIQHQVSQTNSQVLRTEIKALESSIDRAHSELINIDRRVDEIALRHLSTVEVDGVKLRAQELAELVVSGESRFGWFTDLLTLEPRHAPPFSDDEASLLRDARRKLGPDITYVQASIPSAESLPNSKSIGELHAVLVQKRSIEENLRAGKLLAFRNYTSPMNDAAKRLLAHTDAMLKCLTEMEEIGHTWPFELRQKCRQASFTSERAALESLFIDLRALSAARGEFLRTPVTISESMLDNPKAIEAIERAAETGKPFGLVSFGASEIKQQVGSIRIEGRVPSTLSDWQLVKRWCNLHKDVLVFNSRWNALTKPLSLPKLNGGVSGLRDLEIIANTARNAHELATQLDSRFPEFVREVFAASLNFPKGYSKGELQAVQQHLQQNLAVFELSKASGNLGDIREKLAGKTGPISANLSLFVNDVLGNREIAVDEVCYRYSELILELRRISALRTQADIVHDFSNRIEKAGALSLASTVRSRGVDPSGDDKTFPATWREAWTWARIRSYLQSIEARGELISLAERRRAVEEGLARFYREIVAKAAWLSAKANATPKVLQALSGYATAIRRIGMGTGPNATRYRRDAREQMYDAAGAVPCWIMNHNRISESMPADIGSFDLVIVDEASQSDIWALPAILRGKKVLVVGDDKQVSPDAGFIQSTRIQELLDRFLFAQPYRQEMTPEKSLYDLAARVFAADQVMLREHFRCVFPIISFSNRMFYQNQIVPLRLPRASERIEPPLVDIYVEEGVRDSHDRNLDEAEAIADEIFALLQDERFAKRSIGVVSLLATEQAKHIDNVVRQKCDPGELHRRNFLSGDARTFQGSERDIIFLSMVVDRTSCKALSGSLFDQRFNVAASRARDRMYLVRSVRGSELSDRDLRRFLLEHFEKPLEMDQKEVERLSDLCESKFEREVFGELTSRGYRVLPQVKAGAYRIDMVVEGAGDLRLAIELDGDEYHGPDRWRHDMSRQRILERAGWQFWRCFASTWTMRRTEIVFELQQKLHGMGIEPLGTAETGGRLVEKRIWRRSSQNLEQAGAADAS